ncbi:MAG: WD40 repeat domain-containing protein [Treponema sp.]|nr:WD40 repeat domain-containing protein [Treponema sp.]
MKKFVRFAAGCCMAIFVFLLFTACYFNNTPFFPSTHGFHITQDAPFENGSHPVSGMASNGNILVAVSHDRIIARSEDSGVSWTTVPDENIKDNFSDGIQFNAIAYGNGYFLAGGDEGRAAWSVDGSNWQAGVIGPMSPKNILCVAIGAIGNTTVFAAAGNDGRLAHATDSPLGPWRMADQSPFGTVQDFGDDIHALAWGLIKGNGIFVAAGDNGRIAILKDLTGKWWGARAGTGQTYRALAFGNDRFIAAGDNGLIKYSLDPMDYTWNTVQDEKLGLRSVTGIAFDPVMNNFVLYTSDTVVAFSEFGVSWNPANFQERFLGSAAGQNEIISAIDCTATRIVLGGSLGTLVYSN